MPGARRYRPGSDMSAERRLTDVLFIHNALGKIKLSHLSENRPGNERRLQAYTPHTRIDFMLKVDLISLINMWIKIVNKLIKALNGDSSPKEIAGGVMLGAFLGLTPFFALHNLLIIFLIFIIKVNVSAAIFSSLIFGVAGFLFDGASHFIGESLLLSPGLEGLWTSMYNAPILPLTRFNNTVILGSLVLSLLLAVPVYILSGRLVVYYRTNLQARVNKLKIVKFLKASKFYKLYRRFGQ